jgi:hypothetical protein
MRKGRCGVVNESGVRLLDRPRVDVEITSPRRQELLRAGSGAADASRRGGDTAPYLSLRILVLARNVVSTCQVDRWAGIF